MKKRTIIKAAAILGAALLVLIGGILLLQHMEESEYTENRGQMTEGFGQLKTIEWGGRTYREKPAVTTLLIVGTDQQGNPESDGSSTYRHGSPADFLMLLAIDHTDKKIHQLQIDRDTMTDVTVLGVFGNEVGTRLMQICLSHYYGDTLEANAKYTVRAVQNLLDGIEIDGYYMVDYAVMPVLNDSLDGVTVHMDFDMTSENPAWVKGATVTLHGKEAETFVRSRKTIGAGTNEERMVRQAEYMRQAIKKMTQKISGNLEFGESLLKSLEQISTTNMTIRRLADELNQAHNYTILDVDHPAGRYVDGSNGFTEFYMEKNAAVEWALQHLYTLQE